MSDFGHSVWSRSGNQGWPARGRRVAGLTAVARPRKRIDCIPSWPGPTVVLPLPRRRNHATLGLIGFSERSGYTAIGTVCNVAARLCGQARDGQILLSQRVNVALKGSVATEQFGSLVLKGLTHPVVAYNVPLMTSSMTGSPKTSLRRSPASRTCS